MLKGKLTWILRRLVGFLVSICNIPIQDPSYEWGNQSHSSFGTGNGLGKGEQQGHVAVNPVLSFQDPADRGCLETANIHSSNKLVGETTEFLELD